MTYGMVSPPYWSEVWIVGGGPSALFFDLNRLRGKQVLLVNDSAVRLHHPLGYMDCALALFSLDEPWVLRNREFLERFDGEKYLALPEHCEQCAGIQGVKYLRWAHESGLSEDPRFINTGGNSGYGAFNLAVLKRATEIHLVGYDMDQAEDDKFSQWAPKFDSTIPQLITSGVQVWNHNPASHITAFPMIR